MSLKHRRRCEIYSLFRDRLWQEQRKHYSWGDQYSLKIYILIEVARLFFDMIMCGLVLVSIFLFVCVYILCVHVCVCVLVYSAGMLAFMFVVKEYAVQKNTTQ